MLGRLTSLANFLRMLIKPPLYSLENLLALPAGNASFLAAIG
jgi:hypothetical protein